MAGVGGGVLVIGLRRPQRKKEVATTRTAIVVYVDIVVSPVTADYYLLFLRCQQRPRHRPSYTFAARLRGGNGPALQEYDTL